MKKIKTLGALKASKYKSKSIKQELRDNLIERIKSKETVFDGILGFDETVIPDLERAILSQHNILLLGLRGQAKTRLARLMIHLLDEYIPIVKGSELNDDPLAPISKFAIDLLAEKGEETPIEWIHRESRYVEKLATPDVSIADLVGDADPIKAATLKLPYSDERVIHFGLIPRSHRSIFVINELPDLQARIQVSLFNILQEGDMQIRGFKLRLPLDIQFVFTANPEDYTNRGSIITPLKDRIGSQILTHYPKTMEIAKEITAQESHRDDLQKNIIIPELLKTIIERISFEARDSEFIDKKSGVSARVSIAAFEILRSTAERRMLINGAKKTTARLTDLWGVIPAITGKLELVYEGEQEGSYQVALSLLGRAIKTTFLEYFPSPDKLKKGREKDPYGTIREWFSAGNILNLLNDSEDKIHLQSLKKIAGLSKLVSNIIIEKNNTNTFLELVLYGLAECNVITKDILPNSFSFKDDLASMFDEDMFDDN